LETAVVTNATSFPLALIAERPIAAEPREVPAAS